MPRRFVRGLRANDIDIPGVFGVAHALVPGSWRILCVTSRQLDPPVLTRLIHPPVTS